MRANVISVVPGEHPRYDSVSGAAVSTPVVEVEVEYRTDSGDLHSTQRYAFTPDEISDLKVFDRQAEIMQREIQDAIRQTQLRQEEVARVRPVTNKVEELRRHFKLNLSDGVPVSSLESKVEVK